MLKINEIRCALCDEMTAQEKFAAIRIEARKIRQKGENEEIADVLEEILDS